MMTSEQEEQLKEHLLILQSHLTILVEDDTISKDVCGLLSVIVRENYKILSDYWPGWTINEPGEWAPSTQSKVGPEYISNYLSRR